MSSNVTGKLIGGRRVRWDDERAADAYARGWWVRGTLADSLIEAAQRTPQRIVLIDGACQMDCRSLYEQIVGAGAGAASPHTARQRGVDDAAQLA